MKFSIRLMMMKRCIVMYRALIFFTQMKNNIFCRVFAARQCDQMTGRFAEYLAIYSNESLPNSKKLPKKIRTLNKSSKVFAKGFKILPNLVALAARVSLKDVFCHFGEERKLSFKESNFSASNCL